MSFSSLDAYRVAPGLDVFIVPRFAQDVLGMDPTQIQLALETNYPARGAGDKIVPGIVQWVDGDNKALHYRGNAIKRGKIWLQRLPTEHGVSKYGYTGWQWNIVPATATVSKCGEMLPIADSYDQWVERLGYPRANHYIVTKYVDGRHNIGFHSDKPNDIEAGSLITVVKTGAHGRPFELCFPGQEKSPFFSRVLLPGTAVIMTLEANLQTKHGVPVVQQAGPSGSIVFRTIKTVVPPSQVAKELKKRKRVA